MDILVLKLVVSPLLIQAASLAGRRWGEAVAGWFIGLPLTSGPVVLVLALDHGTGFAAAAAAGALAGAAAQAAFCLAYGLAAERAGWPAALGCGSMAFLTAGLVLEMAQPPFAAMPAIAVLALSTALLLWPRSDGALRAAIRPRWDMPARMAVAALLVLGLTAVAPWIGPRAAGLAATYPVFGAVLAVFAQRIAGPTAARQVLRGLAIGLFGFTGFFTMLAGALPQLGIAVSFTLATTLDLAMQGAALWLMRRRPAHAPR